VVAAAVIVGAYSLGHLRPATASASSSPASSASSSAASSAADADKVSVSGVGRVTGTPNLLRLQASIDVTKPDVTSAMQEANTTMASVQKALKSDGVAPADLQTSGFSVQPSYNYTSSGPVLKGYEVSENLSVVLRDLSSAGKTMTDLAQVGGDALRMGGATLDIDEDDALVAQARQKAFDDAKAKASAYAKAAGRSLGPVRSISETLSNPSPIYFGAADNAAAAPSAAPVPIEAGSQDVTVNVSVVWSLS
jgi:uncharacterized protein YggE